MGGNNFPNQNMQRNKKNKTNKPTNKTTKTKNNQQSEGFRNCFFFVHWKFPI